MSDFKQWKEKSHAKDWLLFPENIEKQLSIDEVVLSKGELYTINKKANGKAGSIVAVIAGTKAEQVIQLIILMIEAQMHLQNLSMQKSKFLEYNLEA